MISNLSSVGKYMYVHGGNASTYLNTHAGAQGVGNVRYNISNQQFEVWDGHSWCKIAMDSPVIGLSPEAESLLDWARDRRDEEKTWEKLAEENSAVRIAFDNLVEARRQLDVTAKLAR
jgi:formamidopyrimidine-DNA glycosylase